MEARFPWLATMTEREADLLHQLRQSYHGSAWVADLSQSISRTTPRSATTPCVTPNSRLWSSERNRFILGVEKLALQGLVFWNKHQQVSGCTDDFLPGACALRCRLSH